MSYNKRKGARDCSPCIYAPYLCLSAITISKTSSSAFSVILNSTLSPPFHTVSSDLKSVPLKVKDSKEALPYIAY